MAPSLSGSNRILKGVLTRNTGMKKYIAPVASGERAVSMGGSAHFIFEDLNRSRGFEG